MSRSESYREEHKVVLEKVGIINNLLKNTEENAGTLVTELSNLSGMLRLHLAKEDSVIYPKLSSAEDGNVKSIGEKYQSEMGGIKEVWLGFVSKWNTTDKILAQVSGFKTEIAAVFSALGKRIEAEETELYPLFDRL